MIDIQPTPREKHPDPELRGDKISGERYYSKDFMLKEWNHMWTKVWQIAGIASEIPEPDDFFIYKIGLEEVLVVRQKRQGNCCGVSYVYPDKSYVINFEIMSHGQELS